MLRNTTGVIWVSLNGKTKAYNDYNYYIYISHLEIVLFNMTAILTAETFLIKILVQKCSLNYNLQKKMNIFHLKLKNKLRFTIIFIKSQSKQCHKIIKFVIRKLLFEAFKQKKNFDISNND